MHQQGFISMNLVAHSRALGCRNRDSNISISGLNECRCPAVSLAGIPQIISGFYIISWRMTFVCIMDVASDIISEASVPPVFTLAAVRFLLSSSSMMLNGGLPRITLSQEIPSSHTSSHTSQFALDSSRSDHICVWLNYAPRSQSNPSDMLCIPICLHRVKDDWHSALHLFSISRHIPKQPSAQRILLAHSQAYNAADYRFTCTDLSVDKKTRMSIILQPYLLPFPEEPERIHMYTSRKQHRFTCASCACWQEFFRIINTI
jgi:hypothetical protein